MSDRFNYVKKGYDPAEVEQYIRSLEGELKSYRDKDAVINQAIISAQMAADNIVLNARNQGRAIRENIVKQLEDVSLSISTQKLLLANFVKEYNLIINKYLKIVDNDEFRAISEQIDSMENYLKDFAQEVHEDLQIEKRPESAQAAPKGKPVRKNA